MGRDVWVVVELVDVGVVHSVHGVGDKGLGQSTKGGAHDGRLLRVDNLVRISVGHDGVFRDPSKEDVCGTIDTSGVEHTFGRVEVEDLQTLQGGRT